MEGYDPLFTALKLFRRRKFEAATEQCSKVLNKNPYDQAAWCLKLRCLSEQVYVDEVDNDEEGIAETLLDDNTLAQSARPGTSLYKPKTALQGGMPSQAVRPRTQTGRPLTGVLRPGSQAGRPGTMEQALRTSRTASTARPVTSSTGRFVRMGTASMLSNPDGPFVNVSRLNVAKYAAQTTTAKALFEYLFHHDNDVRVAFQLANAAHANAGSQSGDNAYWQMQMGKCAYRLGLYRDAEKHFHSAMTQQLTIDSVLFLAKVYTRLDQPLAAIDAYKQGLTTFHSDVSLLTGLARISEALNELDQSCQYYKEVLKQDATNIEAIACIATYHFYADQPEIAIRFYRRILQMGVNNASLYTNLGLCCFYAQQYDLALGCLERALSVADTADAPDIYYNVGHVALACGDTNMAYQCFRLSIAANHEHAESLCNLAVLEYRKGNTEQAKAMLQSAMTSGSYTFEPFYNYALLCYELCDYQASYAAVRKALELFPEHADSMEIRKRITDLFNKV